MIDVVPVSVLKDNYVWVLIRQDKKVAVVVDPGEAAPVLTYLNDNGLSLAAVLLTHHHWDHTGGLAEILDSHKGLPVFGSAGGQVEGVSQVVADGDEIICPGLELKLKVYGIPGHTLDHLAFYGEEMLFCGDTLFAAGCGRVFEGTAEQMFQALQRLASLPGNTRVYCAHEYTLNNLRFAQMAEPDNKAIISKLAKVQKIRDKGQPSLPSTIAEEQQTNPFLRCDSPSLIAQVETHAGKSCQTSLDVFTQLRQWKDHVVLGS